MKQKQSLLLKRTDKQDFQFDAADLFEPIMKSTEATSDKLFWETKATTKPFDDDNDKNSPTITSGPGEEEAIKLFFGPN